MLIPLGLDQPNAVSRLRRIAEETRMRKSLAQPSMGSGLLKSALVQKLWLRRIDRQRIGNVYLANVPGPPMPLFLAGARIDRLYPMVPIIGNMTLGVGALSYAGQLNTTVVADFDSCPDVGVFVEGFRRSIAELAASVAEPGDLRAPAQATSTG